MALSKTVRAHSVALAIYLLVTGFINFWAIFVYTVRYNTLGTPDKVAPYQLQPRWAILAFIALSIANLVFVWLIFKWKRAGLIGYVTSHLLAGAIDLGTGARFDAAVLNLLWPTIMIVLVLLEWRDTEW